MTSTEYNDIVDDFVAEFGVDATLQECLDAYHGAHILLTVIDVVGTADGKTFEEMMSYTVQQLKDGIPA